MESNITRDHIALEAMKIINEANICKKQSFFNKVKVFFGAKPNIHVYDISPNLSARFAYEYADAMIAEREKEKSVEE